MSTAMRNKIKRLERALTDGRAPFPADLPVISAEELAAALAVAAPFADAEPGAQVGPMTRRIPEQAAEAVEQARALLQAAYTLGWARLGFQSNPARYLAAALPEMLPEPRSPAAQEMAELLQADALPMVLFIIVPAVKGCPAPEGWRPTR